jgi:hypothetical protein
MKEIAVFIFVLAVFLTVSCGRARKLGESSVDIVVRMIEECPPWPSIQNDDLATKRKLLSCLERISMYDLTTIRKAMIAYADKQSQIKPYNVYSMGRLFVLNRYLFKVPDQDTTARKEFGGFLGPTISSKGINWLWPFSIDSTGKLELTGQAYGYMGDVYLAIDEFDYFNERFGPRKLPQKQ